jgi:hypothetical protein
LLPAEIQIHNNIEVIVQETNPHKEIILTLITSQQQHLLQAQKDILLIKKIILFSPAVNLLGYEMSVAKMIQTSKCSHMW